MTTNPPPRPDGHRVRDALAGRHLVVTGVTGFVGKVWLSHLLAHVPEVGRLTLLVRGSAREPARARMARLFDTSPAFRTLKEQLGRGYAAYLSARVDVVDADLTKPGCGLDDAVAAGLAADADAFVHIAGLTEFHPDPKKGVPANVVGTANLAALAARSPARRVLHMSTAYVAGVREGTVDEQLEPGVSPRGVRFDVDDVIAEVQATIAAHPNPQARTDAVAAIARDLGWPNLYTFTKGLAEHLLAARGLDVAIVRPSVVESSQTWPFPAWNEDLNTSGPIMWFCGTAFPALPSTADHVFDIVPVDAVARWTTVVLAAHLRGRAPRVAHFASGDVNPATFARIVELTALGKRLHARRPGADARERLEAVLDVRAARRDALPWATPDRFEGLAKDALGWLEERPVSARLPGLLRRVVGEAVDRRARDVRKALRDQARELGHLRRVLDQYQPFIHDHDWIFRTDTIRGLVDRLHPEDAAIFGDDLRELDWRRYWLDVQYPGMVRWAFPIVRGETVDDDPPSEPPLVLTPHPLPAEVA